MNIRENDKKYIANTYARFPVNIKSGSGSILIDENGKEYIDMGTGIGVNAFGICDPEWKAAVISQLDLVQHTSNLYYTDPCVILAKEICTRTDMKKVFFSNSGAEANETAIKVARKYSEDKYGADRCNIITMKNSFHGRTLATLAATGQDVFHADFLPMPEGFRYAEAGNIASVKNLASDNKVAAIMFETIQGEGGVLPLDKDFIKAVCAFANENDILIIIDEVQTGNGRTGTLYSYMNYGIKPDIFTTAKGLGGGLPIGAAVLGEKVENVLTYGSHGSTFGGNPVACAGAFSIISRIDDQLLAGVCSKFEYAKSTLKGAKGIKSVTGMGLMIGIETEADASEIINRCIEKGVLALKAKNKIRLLPALNISNELFEKAIDIIKSVCAEI